MKYCKLSCPKNMIKTFIRSLGFQKSNLMSWMRDTLKGDIPGLASDFRLSASRRIPKVKVTNI